jgi:hypothetical protein
LHFQRYCAGKLKEDAEMQLSGIHYYWQHHVYHQAPTFKCLALERRLEIPTTSLILPVDSLPFGRLSQKATQEGRERLFEVR